MMALLIFRAADPSGSGEIASSSIAWMDLTAPEPERGSGHASTPATRTVRRSGQSARSSTSRSASTASAALPPPAEHARLGSLRTGSLPEPLVFGSDRSVLAAAAVPQPPKDLVTVPVIGELAQDRQAPTPVSPLPGAVAVSVAEPQISATAGASPTRGP